MSEAELSGEEIMSQNLAALNAGEDIPHSDDSFPEAHENEPEQEYAEESEGDEYSDDDQSEEELSEIAKKDGYMTKEDWEASGKDPDDYVSQEDFERVGELRDDKSFTRQKMAKELVQTQSMVKEMLNNQNAMIRDAEERARNETIAKLKEEQKQAVDYGETEKAIEIEREINKQEKPVDNTPSQPNNPEGMDEFYQTNNDWYGVHNGATDLLNVHLTRSQRDGIEFKDAIGPAMDKVKVRFGEVFGDEPAPASNQKNPLVRPRATSEKSRRPAGVQAKKKTFNDLPPEMRSFAKRGAKMSGLTESEYMEQMK
jgi:hypothetical protein